MKNKFLVTGATGFIGANIVRALIKKNENVSIITRNKKLSWRLLDVSPKINVYESDLLSPSINSIVNKIKPDYIFHLAAYGVLPKEDDVKKMFDVNLKGTINLLTAVKKNPFKLFINTGSSVEYGIKNSRMKESDILNPINDYGIVKAAATLYCQKEAIRNNLPITTFRLFTPFGYFEDKTRLIPSVILSAIENEPIKISVPTSVRDFIFVEDVVDAYLKATKIQFHPGEILNIGSGKQCTIEQIVKIVIKLTGSSSLIEWGGVKKQERFIEPEKWEADTAISHRILNWKPKYSIEEGLLKTIDWFFLNQKLYV